MSDAPERIWAAGGWADAPHLWTRGLWDLVEDGGGDVEYIRADIHAAEVEALRRENERLRGLVSDIIEAWDWWQIDTYERDADVIVDALDEARAALQGETD